MPQKFKNLKKASVKFEEVKVMNQMCSICSLQKKQLSVFVLKECDAAHPARHILHVTEELNVHAALSLVPCLCKPAGRHTVRAKCAD